MNIWTKTLPFLAAVSLASGCVGVGDDTDSDTEAATDTGGMTAPTTAMSMTAADTGPDDTADDTVGGTAEGTGDTDGTAEGTAEDSTGTTGPDPTIPEFNDTPFEDYVQQDRMGFPGLNTALIPSADKDAYNQGNPADDATLTWDPDMDASIVYLHTGPGGFMGSGLNNDLTGLGLTPCSSTGANNLCATEQVYPAAIPDVLMIDTDSSLDPTNAYQLLTIGRVLEPDIMDVILAVLLLDLNIAADGTINGASPLTFWDLNGDGTPGDSLNPFANDVEFPGAWPHLAAANTP